MRLSYRVSGKVQGVGYRWFVKETAARHSIRGWVRNNMDGSVEGEAQGPVPALDGFLKELKTGHPWAAVTGAETQEMLDEAAGETDFYIKPTAD
ncbi:MAG: acylphosphatase [Elusimicrobia bacterium CG08_land_8_20_14_0_20_59_10]|nr:MAG: acylphosphatase [Elusimicrobia bacterium CG08_land_8_20_14_0_20_59_10]